MLPVSPCEKRYLSRGVIPHIVRTDLSVPMDGRTNLSGQICPPTESILFLEMACRLLHVVVQRAKQDCFGMDWTFLVEIVFSQGSKVSIETDLS